MSASYTVWNSFDTYYQNISSPGSNTFFNVRRGSISPSKFYTCIGEDEYLSPERLVNQMIGKEKRVFTEQQKMSMNRGVNDEPDILNMYRKENNNYTIIKPDSNEYFIWKRDTYIRGIPDSLVLDENGKVVGVVEAKSKKSFDGKINERDWYQILGYMAIFGAKWCDYCVKLADENKYYIIRYDFDEEEWNALYTKLVEFKDKLLLPALEDKKYPIHPPNGK